MEYASEVFERVRKTMSQPSRKQLGSERAARWIRDHATYEQIRYIVDRDNIPSDVSQILYQDVPHLICGEFWAGFREEVGRFLTLLEAY